MSDKSKWQLKINRTINQQMDTFANGFTILQCDVKAVRVKNQVGQTISIITTFKKKAIEIEEPLSHSDCCYIIDMLEQENDITKYAIGLDI
jgi:hypothetical protein